MVPSSIAIPKEERRASRLKLLRHKLVWRRLGAKFLDLGVTIALATLVPYPLGPLLGFIYSLSADGLPWKKLRGQSLGKKVFRLRVVGIGTTHPIHLKQSLIRNANVGVATFFAIIPLWGWLILILVGTPLMLIELRLLFASENGQRLGDSLADTEVSVFRGPGR